MNIELLVYLVIIERYIRMKFEFPSQEEANEIARNLYIRLGCDVSLLETSYHAKQYMKELIKLTETILFVDGEPINLHCIQPVLPPKIILLC